MGDFLDATTNPWSFLCPPRMPFHDDDGHDTHSPSAISHDDKIKAFTFDPAVDPEKEKREKQRKKARFDSKLKKFQEGKHCKAEDSETLRKAKFFTEMQGKDEREKEAKFRREMFNKIAEKFEVDEEKKEKNEEFLKKAAKLRRRMRGLIRLMRVKGEDWF